MVRQVIGACSCSASCCKHPFSAGSMIHIKQPIYRILPVRVLESVSAVLCCLVKNYCNQDWSFPLEMYDTWVVWVGARKRFFVDHLGHLPIRLAGRSAVQLANPWLRGMCVSIQGATGDLHKG
jgi:hypothetical protein